MSIIPLGLNGMILGIHGFCFAVIDSRSGTPNIPLGLTWMILGPSLVTWVFMGSVLLPSILETAMPNFGCQSEPPQALRRFGLVMMRAWMNWISSFCNLKMVSIGSDCRIWVSEQTSSSLVRANLFKS